MLPPVTFILARRYRHRFKTGSAALFSQKLIPVIFFKKKEKKGPLGWEFFKLSLEFTLLVIDSHPIEAVAQHKHLGTIFTPDLKWTRHIQAVIYNASKRAGLLRWMSHHLRGPLTTKLYMAYVRPTMEYASPLWHGSIREEDALPLQRIQTAVARCILQAPWHTPKSQLLNSRLTIAPLAAWNRKFVSAPSLSEPSTRATDKLPTTLCLFSQSAIPEEAKATDSSCSPDNGTHHLFLLQRISGGNTLPAHIQNLTNAQQFRNALTKHFHSQRFTLTFILPRVDSFGGFLSNLVQRHYLTY